MGASYLVLGRAVTQAADPPKTLESIRNSLEGASA
jgi:orotidine-5'-phosphate decarboxylase